MNGFNQKIKDCMPTHADNRSFLHVLRIVQNFMNEHIQEILYFLQNQ